MVTKIALSRQTKLPPTPVLDYFTRVEDFPKVHSEHIKSVKIVREQGIDSITFEQHAVLNGKKLDSLNEMKVDREENKIEIDTIDGDGKGSIVTMTLDANPRGTLVKVVGELQLGHLEDLLKDEVKSTFEKVFEQDMSNLENQDAGSDIPSSAPAGVS